MIPAAVVSLLVGLDLVFNTSAKARLHDRIKRDFIALERQMQTTKATEDNVKQWTGERLRIEADEPPILRILDVLCHNELARAMGCSEEEQVQVRWPQRFLAPVMDFGKVPAAQ